MNGKSVSINRHGRPKTVSGKIVFLIRPPQDGTVLVLATLEDVGGRPVFDSKFTKNRTFFGLVIINVDRLMVDHGESGLVRLWNIGGERKH